jgi:peptidoglycan/xylan/chitin deacetylase (PgdA/CDA1 family)
LRRSVGDGLSVVTYHGVVPAEYKVIDPDLDGSLVTAESLRRQLRLLQNRYHIISPQEFLLWREAKLALPPRSVLLTCDDGLRNTLTIMLPILQELKLPCLFFVTGASLSDTPSMLWYEELFLLLLAAPTPFSFELNSEGQQMSGDGPDDRRSVWSNLVKKLSRHEPQVRRELIEQFRARCGLSEDWYAVYLQGSGRERFLTLTLEELQRLAEAGMTIGAHTCSHPVLAEAPPDLARREIADNRLELERVLGQPIWALAYPFGGPSSVTQREMEIAREVGFKCAFVNFGGGVGSETPKFAMPRVHVTGDMSVAEFEAHVSGFYQSLRRHLGVADPNLVAAG